VYQKRGVRDLRINRTYATPLGPHAPFRLKSSLSGQNPPQKGTDRRTLVSDDSPMCDGGKPGHQRKRAQSS